MTKTSPRFKAVLFDLDNTLYDRYAVFERFVTAYAVTVLKIKQPLTVLDVRDRIMMLDGNGYGDKCAVENEVKRLAIATGISWEAADALAGRFYQDYFTTIQLDQGAKELLAALDEHSIPWGIVTNGRTRQWQKIEKLGLKKMTSTILVSETFGSAKPDKNIFLAASKSLGVPPRNVLFIGDDPINDIGGAFNAGMFTAWVSYGEEWPSKYDDVLPDMVFKCLSDVIPLVRDRRRTSLPLNRTQPALAD